MYIPIKNRAHKFVKKAIDLSRNMLLKIKALNTCGNKDKLDKNVLMPDRKCNS